MIIVKIFYGLMMIGAGYVLIKYRRTVKSWTGNFVWAEQRIGRGGTYIIIMFIGILLMIAGVMYPLGILDLSGSNTVKIN